MARLARDVPIPVYDFVDEGLGHSSYVIDVADGTVALIDPPRFPSAHEALAAQLGATIAWTLDTHSHADYVTGSPALAARTGATFVAPRASQLATPHQPIGDGDHIEFGNDVSIRAVATPGHTPDHHAYILEHRNQPIGLFTGGSLMVGTVGRTDLCGPALAEPLAHSMFQSLRRFADLPDDLTIYPTHGAGSFCSAPGAAQRVSTLGRERATNPLLQFTDEDEFVERLLAGFGTFPDYFARLPEFNRLGPRPYDRVPVLAPLDIDAVTRQIATGALVVDARPHDRFGAGHIAGSLSIELRPVFGSWLGWLVPLNRPVVFVLDADQDRADLVRQCLDIGHEDILGELDGGVDAWLASGQPVARISVTDAAHLSSTVLDVRQHHEFVAGHVPGARNVELGAVPRADAPDTAITVMCGHGERAMTGASILTAAGHHNVSVLEGGPDTWAATSGRALTVG